MRNGSLPEVWIPPAALLDLHDLMRTRLSVCRQKPHHPGASIARLPQETRIATCTNGVARLLGGPDQRLRRAHSPLRIATIGWVRLLKTLPGVGTILGCTLYLEIGDVRRFATPEKLPSYAGLMPTVHASGGKLWQGPTPRSANLS